MLSTLQMHMLPLTLLPLRLPACPRTPCSQPKQPVDIKSLLGPLPIATTPAVGSGPSSKGPLPLDDFCEIPAAAPAATPAATAVPAAAALPAAAGAAGFDPFSGGSGWTSSSTAAAPAAGAAGAAAGASDPFAASGAVHMMAQAPKQHAAANGPKLGPETAKAKDPFADLAFI